MFPVNRQDSKRIVSSKTKSVQYELTLHEHIKVAGLHTYLEKSR